MGSPLSPLISNLVMEDVKKRALVELFFKPILYKRCLDDMLTIVPTDKITEFFYVFNSIEQSSKFTLEKEEINTLNVLELKIIKNSNGTSITN